MPWTKLGTPAWRTQDFQRAFDRFKELADRKGEIGEEGLRAIVAEETRITGSEEMTLVKHPLLPADRPKRPSQR